MTIGKKFALTCAALMAFCLLLGGTALYSINGLNGTLQAIVVDSLPGVERIAAVRGMVLEVRGNAWHHLAVQDRQRKDEMDRVNEALEGKIDQALKAYEATITQPEDRAMFNRLGPALQPLSAGVGFYARAQPGGQECRGAGAVHGKMRPGLSGREAGAGRTGGLEPRPGA